MGMAMAMAILYTGYVSSYQALKFKPVQL